MDIFYSVKEIIGKQIIEEKYNIKVEEKTLDLPEEIKNQLL